MNARILLFTTGLLAGGYHLKAQVPVWSEPLPQDTTRQYHLLDLATDSAGNSYLLLKRSTLVIPFTLDVVLYAFDTDGLLLWQDSIQQLPTSGDLDIAPGGDLLLVATRESTEDILTRRYAPDGTVIWTQTYANFGQSNVAIRVKVDPDGRAFVAGSTVGSPQPNQEALVLGYAPSGAYLFDYLYSLPGVGGSTATDLTVDTTGQVIVSGRTGWHPFTLALDTLGNLQWLRLHQPAVLGEINRVDMLPNGNIRMTGWDNTPRMYLYTYAPDGTELDSTFFPAGLGTGDTLLVMDVAIGPTGTQYVFSMWKDTGGNPGSARHTAAFALDGTNLWEVLEPSNGTIDLAYDLELDPLDRIYTASTGGTPQQHVAYVRIHDPMGMPVWNNGPDSLLPRYRYAQVELDAAGNFYVCTSFPTEDPADPPVVLTKYSMPVGVEEQRPGGAGLTVWPNPAGDEVRVLPSGTGSGVLELLDPAGRLIHSVSSTDRPIDLHLEGLAAGPYILRWIPADGQVEHGTVLKP
ncbi:MAG: hypothetical protein KDC02_25285 [Flavobacteriales bacterium]|nr:hypothetical protein [Flavobacteriales bacterium]